MDGSRLELVGRVIMADVFWGYATKVSILGAWFDSKEIDDGGAGGAGGGGKLRYQDVTVESSLG